MGEDKFKMKNILARAPFRVRLANGAEGSFNRLIPRPDMKTAWVTAPDALLEFMDRTPAEITRYLEIADDLVIRRLERGWVYKLMVFPVGPESGCVQADWDGLVNTMCKCYPTVADKLRARLPELRGTPLEEIKRQAAAQDKDWDMVKAGDAGGAAPVKTLADLERAEGTLPEVRQFLWCWVGANDRFVGDGYVKGTKTPEYIAENRELKDIASCVLIDLNLDIKMFDKTQKASRFTLSLSAMRFVMRWVILVRDWSTSAARCAGLIQ